MVLWCKRYSAERRKKAEQKRGSRRRAKRSNLLSLMGLIVGWHAVQFLLVPSPFWLSSASLSFYLSCSRDVVSVLRVAFRQLGWSVCRPLHHCVTAPAGKAVKAEQSLYFFAVAYPCFPSLVAAHHGELMSLCLYLVVLYHILAWWGRCLCFRSTYFYFMP